jgi:hypothetical protein
LNAYEVKVQVAPSGESNVYTAQVGVSLKILTRKLYGRGNTWRNRKKMITMMQMDKNALREHMTMKAFTFYLDDITKLCVIQKLKSNGLDTKKGSLAALIRVLLSDFADMDQNDPKFASILAQVENEYTFTTKKNKRSTM